MNWYFLLLLVYLVGFWTGYALGAFRWRTAAFRAVDEIAKRNVKAFINLIDRAGP